jgi:hypothetical protein
MASATLSSTSISDGTTLDYTVSGYYLHAFKATPARYEFEEVAANGVDGMGTKNHGSRESTYTLTVHAIQSTETKCVTGLLGLMADLLSSGTFSFTIAGNTGIGRLVGEQSSVDQPKNTGRGTFRAEANIVIRKVRDS